MHNKPIILTLIVLIGLMCTGLGDVTKIPASKAMYVDMENMLVHNNTSILKCEVQTGVKANYTAAAVIQFNTSGLNISDNDIGVLVLKVVDVEKHSNASNMVVLMPIGSNWDENSGYLSLIANMEPILNLVSKKDISQMGVSTNDGQVFDVSETLREMKANSEKVSFLLMAFSDKSYSVEFKSVRSSESPFLVVMPYPTQESAKTDGLPVPIADKSKEIDNNKLINKTIELDKSILDNETRQIRESVMADINEQTNDGNQINESSQEKSLNESIRPTQASLPSIKSELQSNKLSLPYPFKKGFE